MKGLAVSVQKASSNRKFGPVAIEHLGNHVKRFTGTAPFVSSTYVSIDSTCPTSCPFKDSGCFVQTGFSKHAMRTLDDAALQLTPAEVIAQEVAELDRTFPNGVPRDGARGGRDLRIHVGGDTPDAASARRLGWAAYRWHLRGGGRVWTYTHRWREIPRADFGDYIAVIASVETPADIVAANRRGYAAAITVQSFPSDRAFRVDGGGLVVPCPAETRGATCSSCRLCLDRDLLSLGVTIGFAVHGTGAEAARRRLPVLRAA